MNVFRTTRKDQPGKTGLNKDKIGVEECRDLGEFYLKMSQNRAEDEAQKL